MQYLRNYKRHITSTYSQCFQDPFFNCHTSLIRAHTELEALKPAQDEALTQLELLRGHREALAKK